MESQPIFPGRSRSQSLLKFVDSTALLISIVRYTVVSDGSMGEIYFQHPSLPNNPKRQTFRRKKWAVSEREINYKPPVLHLSDSQRSALAIEKLVDKWQYSKGMFYRNERWKYWFRIFRFTYFRELWLLRGTYISQSLSFTRLKSSNDRNLLFVTAADKFRVSYYFRDDL